jgi:multidrug efflux pump subunit AcrA (membrane-fusion protein)
MEDQLHAAEKLAPIELDFSQRRAKNSEEDLANYLETDRPFYLKMADFSLREANNKLEYDEEELKQLEKMYKADDVSEETEKIVMKRAQDTVNRSKFYVEYQELSRDQTLKYSIPRMDNQIKETAQRWAIDWEKNKVELPLLLQKQRFELEKLKVQRERLADKLKKLQADRNLMTVKSPIDGVVYYGKSVRGRFADSTNIGENLRPNNVIQPNQTIMTVVQPQDMFIHAAVAENQLHYMHHGLKGKATPTAYPDTRLGVVVKQLGDVPIAPGSFDVRLSLTGDEPDVTLEPGMTCKVKLTVYLKKEALTVPPKVLTPDELSDQKFYVYVLTKNGKTKKVGVTVGEKNDKKAEILKGLHEGDQVLLEAPKN